MNEQEQIKLMKKIAAKLFKRMRRVMEDEFRAEALSIADFHNIAFSSMAWVNANLIMWVKHQTEIKTSYVFDYSSSLVNFMKSILDTINLIESDNAKKNKELQ